MNNNNAYHHDVRNICNFSCSACRFSSYFTPIFHVLEPGVGYVNPVFSYAEHHSKKYGHVVIYSVTIGTIDRDLYIHNGEKVDYGFPRFVAFVRSIIQSIIPKLKGIKHQVGHLDLRG